MVLAPSGLGGLLRQWQRRWRSNALPKEELLTRIDKGLQPEKAGK
jgi:hypothetical protein